MSSFSSVPVVESPEVVLGDGTSSFHSSEAFGALDGSFELVVDCVICLCVRGGWEEFHVAPCPSHVN